MLSKFKQRKQNI